VQRRQEETDEDEEEEEEDTKASKSHKEVTCRQRRHAHQKASRSKGPIKQPHVEEERTRWERIEGKWQRVPFETTIETLTESAGTGRRASGRAKAQVCYSEENGYADLMASSEGQESSVAESSNEEGANSDEEEGSSEEESSGEESESDGNQGSGQKRKKMDEVSKKGTRDGKGDDWKDRRKGQVRDKTFQRFGARTSRGIFECNESPVLEQTKKDEIGEARFPTMSGVHRLGQSWRGWVNPMARDFAFRPKDSDSEQLAYESCATWVHSKSGETYKAGLDSRCLRCHEGGTVGDDGGDRGKGGSAMKRKGKAIGDKELSTCAVCGLWFHLDCLGLSEQPAQPWSCPHCDDGKL
jgi:hypothetical protein